MRHTHDIMVDGTMRMHIRLISLSQEEIVPGFSVEFKIDLRSGTEFG